jgi:hypothetical protein
VSELLGSVEPFWKIGGEFEGMGVGISGFLRDTPGETAGTGDSEMAAKVRFLGLPTPLFARKESLRLERLIIVGGMGSVLLETLERRWTFTGGKVSPLLETFVRADANALPRVERFDAGGGTAFPVLDALVDTGGRDSTLLGTSVGKAGRVRELLLLLEMFSFRTLFVVCGIGLDVPFLLDEP